MSSDTSSIDDIFSTKVDETPQKDSSAIISRGEIDKSTFSIDDELADFLGENSSNTPISNIKIEPISTMASSISEKKVTSTTENTDANDFMSWLSDVTDTNILTETKPNTNGDKNSNDIMESKGEFAESKLLNSVSQGEPSKTATSTTTPSSMDTFLEDILGESKSVSKVPSSATTTNTTADISKASSTSLMNSTPDSITFSTDSSSLPASANLTSDYADFDSQIDTILKSSFPNISKLKDIITRHMGYIPDSQRGSIWNLLLTGQLSEDFEASSVGSVLGCESVANFDKLVNDIEEVVSNSFLFGQQNQHRSVVLDKAVLKQSLQNILVLYCTRKQVPYSSYLLLLLAPLLTAYEPIPMSIASSCFYNLVTDFIPFTDTQVCIIITYTYLPTYLVYKLLYHPLFYLFDRVRKGNVVSLLLIVGFDCYFVTTALT